MPSMEPGSITSQSWSRTSIVAMTARTPPSGMYSGGAVVVARGLCPRDGEGLQTEAPLLATGLEAFEYPCDS